MSVELNSDKAPEPVGLYPHARKVGNLLFYRVLVPEKEEKKEIPGVTLDDSGKIKRLMTLRLNAIAYLKMCD